MAGQRVTDGELVVLERVITRYMQAIEESELSAVSKHDMGIRARTVYKWASGEYTPGDGLQRRRRS